MLTYVVTSEIDRTIDFLGVFKAGEQKVFGETDIDQFRLGRGVPNLIDALPEDATVTIYVQSDAEDPEGEENLEPMSDEEAKAFEENVLHIDTHEEA
jgi:hypothetical protein